MGERKAPRVRAIPCVQCQHITDIITDGQIKLDYRGSWFKLTTKFPKPMDQFKIPLDTSDKKMGEFVKKGPAGIRKIRHRLQDINCNLQMPIEIVDNKVILDFEAETGGPIEIKRAAKGALGKWRDAYAYDVNLKKLNFKISFCIGPESTPIDRNNIICDLDVNVDLDADISNVPDRMEVWGTIDRRISREMKKKILEEFQSEAIKQLVYTAVLQKANEITRNEPIDYIDRSGDKIHVHLQ